MPHSLSSALALQRLLVSAHLHTYTYTYELTVSSLYLPSLVLRSDQLREELSAAADARERLRVELTATDFALAELRAQMARKKATIAAAEAAARTGTTTTPPATNATSVTAYTGAPTEEVDEDLLDPHVRAQRHAALTRMSNEVMNKETERSVMVEQVNKLQKDEELFQQRLAVRTYCSSSS